MIKAIFACDDEWGIGKNNSLPWPHNSEDLKWFKRNTDGHAVVMGRNTWESLPKKPLPNRFNFVISSNPIISDPMPQGVYGGQNPSRIIKEVIEARYLNIGDIWIIGGAQLFNSCIDIIDEIYISRIEGSYNCDVFLPYHEIMKNYNYTFSTENGLYIEKWKKIR
jgi:dihydrofolate reductase